MINSVNMIKAITTAAFLCVFSSAVYAAGDDSSTPKPKECPEGQVWSETAKKCVVKSSEILTDQDLYVHAVSLIESKKYEEGLDILWRIKDQNQPRVLNYIGYSNRKLGKVEKGIGYYKKALAIDVNFHQARQYLGEGYLQKGDLNKAEGQLEELANRCGKGCEYYKDLDAQIVAYRASKSAKSQG